MTLSNLTPFAFTLASTTLASQRAQFNLRFNILQNSLINRHNATIDKINTTPTSTQRQIDDLQKREKKLLDAIPVLEDFTQGNLNNQGALERIFDEITSLFQTFNTDATVDASEVAAFEAQRDVVATRIENLYIFSHPDINDGQVVQRLKEDVATIRGLSVSAGNLTDPGNQAVADTLSLLQSEVSVAITVTKNTVATTIELQERLQSQFASADADLLKLTSEEKSRREKAISDSETQLGNLLRAISISFEANAGLSDALASRLRPQLPPPGSAVNIIS